MSLARVALLVLIAQFPASMLEAAPIKVHLVEGNARGFLVLRTAEGEAIAHGEIRQKPSGPYVESRLLLNFKDGSVRDEVVTFSQTGIFRLEAYRLRQRGASFPTAEVSFDRRTGRYQARTQEKKGDEEKTATGTMEMPADLYNGLVLTLLKNVPRGSSASGQIAAFTPKPRLVKMRITTEGEDRVVAGGDAKKATRYLVKLELGGLTGMVAGVIGKEPPALRYWLVPGDVPAFARFEGAMFVNGPVWRLEMEPVEWPK